MRFKGQSLIEVLISLGLVVILAVSLITASLITQKTARSARNDTQASKLAQGDIERTRIYMDRIGFSQLPADNTCFTVQPYDKGDPTAWSIGNLNCSSSDGFKYPFSNVDFYRKIKIEAGANDKQKKITVTTTWTDSGGKQSVTDTTFLSDCKTTSC